MLPRECGAALNAQELVYALNHVLLFGARNAQHCFQSQDTLCVRFRERTCPLLKPNRIQSPAFVCYAVFVTAGRRGLQKTGVVAQGSVWNPRVTLDPARYAALSARGGGADIPFQWRDEYMAWASDTGNRWAVLLLPFLLMLRFCSVPQERSAESHIYTLF